ncbi:MAG: toll/interleukin-1 receptor domain-containing protein [Geminicoccaceae bacterium]
MSGAPAGYDVFLSYSRADQAAADALRDRLAHEPHNLKVFIDWRALAAGRPWQPALEAALLGCRAMLVLIGPKGIGGWQHREIQLGLDRQTGAEKTPTPFPVIPVLLPGLEPDDYPLGTFLALNTWVAFEHTVDEPLPLQRLLSAIQGLPLDAPRDLTALRPYRGLLAFREQDAGLFFGRERFVDELVTKVRQRSAANLVAVLGRSGSGKSSVVFAGLFPELRQERGVGQQAVWNIASLRPGRLPLHALIETFDPPDPALGETETLAVLNRRAELLRKGEATLAQLVARRIEKDQGTTRQLLYVDQWEELYTQAQPREPKTAEDQARVADARLFVDLVLDAAANSPCTLVLSVRSDFYPDIQTHDRLRAAVQDCQVSLGPMTKAELTAAIERPAQVLGRSVEPELTTRLLRDIGLDPANPRTDHYEIGKLPLLEFALERAWNRAKDGHLGLAHYAGLEQALEERANAIYERLLPDQRAAAKRLFVSLVNPGEGREDTRARITLSADPTLESVTTAFTASDARLIVTGDDAAGARSAEVSHEALIRHWERLRGWIDENRANLRTRSALVADRVEWVKRERPEDLLIPPGFRLEAARQLWSQPGDVRTDDIEDYIRASDTAAAATKRRERQRAEDEVRQARSATAIGLTAIFSIIGVAFLSFFGYYIYSTSRPDDIEANAAMIWSNFDSDTDRIAAGWKLSTSKYEIRDAFLYQLKKDQRYEVDTLFTNAKMIRRSFGLRPSLDQLRRLIDPAVDAFKSGFDMPDRILELLSLEIYKVSLMPVLNVIRSSSSPRNLTKLIQILQSSENLTDSAQTAIVELIIADISEASEPRTLRELAHALQGLQPTFEQSNAALEPLLDVIRRTTEVSHLWDLAQAVQILEPTPDQAQSALEPILVVVRNTTDPWRLLDLAQAIQALAPTPEQAQSALDQILNSIRQASNPGELATLAQAVQTLGPTHEKAMAAFGPLLQAIHRTTDPGDLSALARAVQSLDPTPEEALAALGPLLQAIRRQNTTSYNRLDLARTVQALALKLTPEQAQAEFDLLLDAIGQTSDPFQSEALALAVQAVTPRLPPEQAQVALRRVLDATSPSIFPNERQALAQAIQALALKLTPELAQAAFDSLLDAIGQTYEFHKRETLALAVQALSPRLPPEQTQSALRRVLNAERQSISGAERQALAQAVQAFALTLTPEQAQATFGPLFDAIGQTTDPFELLALAQAAQALTPEQAQATIGSVVNIIRQTPFNFLHQDLAQTGQALASKLSLEQAQLQLGSILDGIRQAADPQKAKILAQIIQALAPKLTPKYAEAAFGPLLDAIRQTSPHSLLPGPAQTVETLAQTVETLAPKLAPEQVQEFSDLSRAILATATVPSAATSFARAIAVTLPVDPAKPQPYVANIVELLKWPTTAEPGATEALLEVLHDRVPGAPGKEAGLDATVRWVATTFPEIDLDSPPTPPASGSTGAAW